MSQHDLNIANQGFPAFRADLNDALVALGSTNSGATAPATTFANQLWYDTANNILKIRNEDNDAWISIVTLDQSADNISSITAQTIGINTSSPSTQLQMNSGAATYSDQLRIRNTNFGNADIGVGSGIMALATDMSNIAFYTNSSLGTTGSALPTNERMRITSAGDVGIGTNDPASFGKFAVVGTNTSSPLIGVRDNGTPTGNLVSISANSLGTALAVNSAGNTRVLNLGLGGITPSTSGTGITFPATQSASSDANTLDDYEEGTWTPSDVSGAGLSFTGVAGFYVKIGKYVMASAQLTFPSTANTSAATIGGLPFASGSDGTRTAFISYNNALADSMNISGGGAASLLITKSDGSLMTNLQCSGKIFYFAASYITA
jgi:hypothetical protein